MDQIRYKDQMRKVKELNQRRDNLKSGMNQMKHEIAEELMISRETSETSENITYAGNVGGTMTKRLVQMGQEIALKNTSNNR